MPLAGHDFEDDRIALIDYISIHVPLAGHDGLYVQIGNIGSISIHVPLAGHDPPADVETVRRGT